MAEHWALFGLEIPQSWPYVHGHLIADLHPQDPDPTFSFPSPARADTPTQTKVIRKEFDQALVCYNEEWSGSSIVFLD